jgi:hypothetical protein
MAVHVRPRVTAVYRARRSSWWGAVLGLTLLAAVAPAAFAAEMGPSTNRLETPMADLAILDEPATIGGEPVTPRLLVLDAADPAPAHGRLTVLLRRAVWDPIATRDVDLERDDVTARWLISLGERRYALIATTPTSATGTGHATVVGLHVREQGGSTAIVETARTRVDRAIEYAGAADVDGFGAAELIVGFRPEFDDSGSCGTTSLQLMDRASLDARRTFDLPGVLGGGAMGRWDDVPGDDLLVYADLNCAPGGPTDAPLLTLRLRDGTVSALNGPGGPSGGAIPPIRLRLDGDPRDRAVVAVTDGVAIVDPGRDAMERISKEPGIPLVAGPDPDAQGPATRIAWFDGNLHAERFRLGSDGSIVGSTRSGLGFDTLDEERRSLMIRAINTDVFTQGLSSAWLGDVIDDGCADLILPGAILPCGADTMRPAAAWLATRPVAAMPIEGRRALLIAAGLGWDPDRGLPVTPTPLAAGPDGWWRHGPSTPFAISEVRGNDAIYFQEFPTPAATIEKTTARDGTTLLPGFTGTRFFVLATPLVDDQEGPDVAPASLEGLTTGPGPDVVVTTARVPVPAGNESGRDGSFTSLSLGDVRFRDGGVANRWALQVVPINDWGEVGFPVVRTITRDAVGPTLNLQTPFTSPVWPFLARLPGRAEPGSTVSLEGAGDLTVDERGRFTVETRLAPWPQTLRLTATDATGNASIAEFTIVGGIDYRQFPWALIAALSLLGIVAARGLASAGRTRGGGVEATLWSTGTLDDAAMPEIEELPPGAGLAPR